jgi:ABC-type transport system involved in multi-copper enzyme maturation permease subunit
MTALVGTELLKPFWTRATWFFLAAALLLSAFRVGLVLTSVGKVGSPLRGSTDLTLTVLGASGMGGLVVALLAVVIVTREFHHATWTSTLLITPSRRRVLVAKFVAAAVVGAVLAAVMFVVAAILGLISGDVTIGLDRRLAQLLIGRLVAAAFWAWLCAAIAALIGNQTVALFVPPVLVVLIGALLPAYGLGTLIPWTPDGAVTSLVGGEYPGALPIWAALLVLISYGLAASIAGLRRVQRADVC